MCKLLMIDDNKVEHLIVQKMFEHYNLFSNGEHSEDGEVMLDYIKENQSKAKALPDIILLDLNMPKFSGWDFLKKLKKFYPALQKKIDIFILSSSIDPMDKEKSKQYPFVKDFFIKPLKKETMVDLYATYKLRR